MHQYDLVKAAIDAIVKDAVSPSTKAKIKRRAQRLVNKWRTGMLTVRLIVYFIQIDLA